MPFSALLFAVGLVLLIQGSDWFVDGATGIAKRFILPGIAQFPQKKQKQIRSKTRCFMKHSENRTAGELGLIFDKIG